MKRTIVHVIGSLGIGGAQTMLYELYRSIDLYYPKVNQKIISLNKTKMKQGVISSYDIPYRQSLSGLFPRMMREMKGDHLIVFHKLMCSDLSGLRQLYGKIPIVLINHTHSDSKVYNRINHVDHVVTVCKNMKKNLRRLGVSAPITVIPNGVNGSMYDLIKPSAGIPDVLLTGRVNALNSIKYSSKWIKWCMNAPLPKKMIHQYIGPGEPLKKARGIASDTNCRNAVQMLGRRQEFEDKISLVKSWDVFLYEINRPEGMSMAILESLACGVPVVCSNHAGNNEIIEDGVNGFVFSNKSDAECILTELCLNPELLIKLKSTTKQHFTDHLDAKVMAKRYMKLFKDVSNQWTEGSGFRSSTINEQISIRKRRKRIIQSDKPQVRKKIRGESKKRKKRKKLNAIDNVSKDGTFTILTAGRNNAAFINDWAKSILSQTYRPLNVIFVDDASRDKTSERVRSYSEEFENHGISLTLIKNKKRLFCSSSYQVAYENSVDSTYWGILDADDMLSNGAVSYIADLYEKYPKVTWIYTQYQSCNIRMTSKGKGFCKPPKRGGSLLDLGKRNIHAYSHWRTFCHRFPKPKKLWKPGLKSSVDKFMGYRLEEFGIGLFTNKVCYMYRQGVSNSISKTEKTRQAWEDVKKEAFKRRKKYGLKAYPVIIHRE
jgi:glycosyltransferase involved in cell wall biosynthesis